VKTARLIEPTLKRHRLKPRKGYADGGTPDDDLPDVGEPAIPSGPSWPGTAIGNKAADIGSKLAAGAAKGWVTLPQRALDASAQDVGHLGEEGYEPQSVGPAAETALSMVGGAGVVPAEANALRTGIGIYAKGQHMERLPQFERLEGKGVSPEMNYTMTGWYRGGDGQPRSWLSDSGSKLKDDNLPTAYTENGPQHFIEADKPKKMGDIWDHPKLYEAYPWLKDVPVKRETNPKWGGHYDPNDGTISVRQLPAQSFEDTLHHEAVHAIQHFEGFANGTNAQHLLPPSYMKTKAAADQLQQKLDTQVKASGIDPDVAQMAATGGLAGPEAEAIKQKLEAIGLTDHYNLLSKAKTQLRAAEDEAFQRYMHSHGESEARDAPFIKNAQGKIRPGIPLHVNPDIKPGRTIEVGRPFPRMERARGGVAKAGGGALPAGFDVDSAPSGLPAGFDVDAPAAGPPVSVAGDIAKESGKGLVRGVESAAGDVGEAVMGPFGPSHHWGNLMADLGLGQRPKTDAPYGAQMAKATGMTATPQTPYGKYAGAITESVGNPESYLGPGGPAAKLFAAGAAGAGSEAAGEAAEGTGLEPAARILGGMGAGSAASTLSRTVGAARARVPSPTTDELHAASQTNYNNMKGFGVELHPHVMDQVATNIETELLNEGYRPWNTNEGHNQLFRAVDELRNPVGRYTTMSDVDAPRRVLNRLAGNPSLRDGARRAIDEIDTRMVQLTPADAAINGHFIPRVVQEANEARGNYAAFKHAEQLDTSTDKAGLIAASTGSGANIDNATRQQMRQILTNPKKLRGFSPGEQVQMRQIVNGTFAGNAARLVGKLAPTGVVSGGLGALVGHTLGHTIGIPVIGAISKAAGDAATNRAAARLSEMVRLRSPLARRMGSTPLPPQVPTGARTAGSMARFGMPASQNPFENPNSP
jgi:hypothetical protein